MPYVVYGTTSLCAIRATVSYEYIRYGAVLFISYSHTPFGVGVEALNQPQIGYRTYGAVGYRTVHTQAEKRRERPVCYIRKLIQNKTILKFEIFRKTPKNTPIILFLELEYEYVLARV